MYILSEFFLSLPETVTEVEDENSDLPKVKEAALNQLIPTASSLVSVVMN